MKLRMGYRWPIYWIGYSLFWIFVYQWPPEHPLGLWIHVAILIFYLLLLVSGLVGMTSLTMTERTLTYRLFGLVQRRCDLTAFTHFRKKSRRFIIRYEELRANRKSDGKMRVLYGTLLFYGDVDAILKYIAAHVEPNPAADEPVPSTPV